MIFTIGHSTHPIDTFLKMLKEHKIEAIADVRSSPYSKFNPQYNREELKKVLADQGVKYVFLGKELGARSDDPCCYKQGRVDYDLLAKTELFQKGIDRVLDGAKKMRLALMCAEAEPLDCHRTILVSKELSEKEVKIVHILKNLQVETHTSAINRLVKNYVTQSSDLFMSEEEVINNALKKRAEEIAYVEEMAS